MEILERYFGLYLLSLFKEGKRFVEIKSLVLTLEVVKSTRKLAVNLFIGIFGFIIFVAGILVSTRDALIHYAEGRSFSLDVIFITGLSLSFLGLLVTIWAMREKRWINLLQLDKRIRKVQDAPPPTEKSRESVIDMELISSLISSIVEKKLKEYASPETGHSEQGKSEKENIRSSVH